MTEFSCCTDCSNDECGERMCHDNDEACTHGYPICDRCCAELHDGLVPA